MSDTRTPIMRTKHTVNTTQHMHLGLLTHPNNDIVHVILTRDTKPVVANEFIQRKAEHAYPLGIRSAPFILENYRVRTLGILIA